MTKNYRGAYDMFAVNGILFLETAFGHAGLDREERVKFDERYLRPNDVDALVGDASKAKDVLC